MDKFETNFFFKKSYLSGLLSIFNDPIRTSLHYTFAESTLSREKENF